MNERKVYGALEGGGTKFACAIGTGPDDLVDERIILTGDPTDTLGEAIEFFLLPRSGVRLGAIGIAMFGPIELDQTSRDYGSILQTPKPGWSGARILAPLARRLKVPLGWDTDVNAAALGEARWGAGRDADPLLYLTIGTGIGGGVLQHGAPLHGLLHPELGHIPVPLVDGDRFPGSCPFHGRCLEGLASGTAVLARTGHPAEQLAADDPVWHLLTDYLASALATYVLCLSPRRIILGGGLLRRDDLLPRIRAQLRARLNGYVDRPELNQDLDAYVVKSALDQRAGVYGGFVLAEEAAGASIEAGPARPGERS